MAACSGNPCTGIISSAAVEAVSSAEKYVAQREGFGGRGVRTITQRK